MVNHEGSRGTIGWAGFQPGHDYSDSAACALRRVLIGMVTLSHISSTRLNTHSHYCAWKWFNNFIETLY